MKCDCFPFIEDLVEVVTLDGFTMGFEIPGPMIDEL